MGIIGRPATLPDSRLGLLPGCCTPAGFSLAKCPELFEKLVKSSMSSLLPLFCCCSISSSSCCIFKSSPMSSDPILNSPPPASPPPIKLFPDILTKEPLTAALCSIPNLGEDEVIILPGLGPLLLRPRPPRTCALFATIFCSVTDGFGCFSRASIHPGSMVELLTRPLPLAGVVYGRVELCCQGCSLVP
ncbi:hypothetical protein L7F22_058463 [Adiantum nelumboides]|nr:hypothetical protein [Adiantum nelumboides]